MVLRLSASRFCCALAVACAATMEELREAGERLQAGEEFDAESIAVFEKRAKEFPKDWRAHAMLGQAQTQRSQHDDAVTSLRVARKLAPSVSQVATALANAHDALAGAVLAETSLSQLTATQRKRLTRSLRKAIELRDENQQPEDSKPAALAHDRLSRVLVSDPALDGMDKDTDADADGSNPAPSAFAEGGPELLKAAVHHRREAARLDPTRFTETAAQLGSYEAAARQWEEADHRDLEQRRAMVESLRRTAEEKREAAEEDEAVRREEAEEKAYRSLRQKGEL